MKVSNKKLDVVLAKKRIPITRLRSKGLSPQTISKIRKGEDVMPATIGTLAEKLGVDVMDIIEAGV